jgi:DNA-binding CsgD family transcriptional regulator
MPEYSPATERVLDAIARTFLQAGLRLLREQEEREQDALNGQDADAQARAGAERTCVMVTQSPFRILSKHEEEVAALIAQGRTYQEIADSLFVSTNTIRAHMRSAFQKTDSRNRTELALWWLRAHGRLA